MSITNPESVIKDLQQEIVKNRKVLDQVYIDTENLKRDRTSFEGDILRLSKHVKYQEEISLNKDKEISDKQAVIIGLDSQITDKGKRRDELEGTINEFETSLREKRNEYEQMENAIVAHKEHIRISSEDLVSKHEEADAKTVKVETRIKKIEQLLAELK